METAIFVSGEGSSSSFLPERAKIKRDSRAPAHRWAVPPDIPMASARWESDETDTSPCAPSNRIQLNISGERYEVPFHIFTRHPTSLMGNIKKIAEYYDPSRGEYYFDRNRACFEAILAYYQSGTLHRPSNIPLKFFIEESRFFQLDETAWMQLFKAEGFTPHKKIRLPKRKFQRQLWLLVDDPRSSTGAKVFSIFSLFVIILSVIDLCLETLPQFRDAHVNMTAVYVELATDSEALTNAEFVVGKEAFREPLFVVSAFCVSWFTVEFFLRLLSCPDKKEFFKSGINLIDLTAILPCYIDIAVTFAWLNSGITSETKTIVMGILRVLRVVRIFRLVRLSRYSRGLQLLGETFLVSGKELGLLLLFLAIGIILFSSAIYYAELGIKDSQFNSIPEGFWWAIVTMTTVGYGDIVPRGIFGKLVGACCAVSGLMAIALPVPVIVSNFSTLYRREKQRSEVEELLKDVLQSSESSTQSELCAVVVHEQGHLPSSESQNTVVTVLNGSYHEKIS